MTLAVALTFWAVVLVACRVLDLSDRATLGVVLGIACFLWLLASEGEKIRGLQQCESPHSSHFCDPRRSDLLHGF